MRQDLHLNDRAWAVPPAPRHFLHAGWMLWLSLLLGGCGGGDSAPAAMAVPQQAPSEQSPWATQGTAPGRETPAPSSVTDEPAVPLPGSPELAQLDALPHLSSLSEREKAGLLMLLPSRSPAQRMALINMYPTLVRLPEQQKELLLDRLEKIVPVTVSQRQ
ncbi:hypothetical protein [Cupriavidus taiwanensis]|uniref:hypothetical protein n=1 Tax=Cupriavidus taiwanensis TaxID=164546 RepID=UPI000E10AABE|nr:hypothetical protein [Cupriavidus taiwanensis]SOY61307.1 conserved hypothetical protein [Cupriavidus taiwanensis]SOY73721.1 conserved hypothetical protein [Cupriavidus taiwanensis]SOY97800.1 conserved hypothetical protein [Cupriavidus taiwanensis]SOZ67628.1 conserved hypothetical protein [Cupriavidus taiwanensis]SOZ84719.1 conserved hypothetical protein [Cupriavidus taiwanensis]